MAGFARKMKPSFFAELKRRNVYKVAVADPNRDPGL
jgi:ABC-type molybdate transport system substrate-binding protein